MPDSLRCGSPAASIPHVLAFSSCFHSRLPLAGLAKDSHLPSLNHVQRTSRFAAFHSYNNGITILLDIVFSLQVTDAHFDHAIGGNDQKALQNPVQYMGPDMTSEKAVQQSAESARTGPQAQKQTPANTVLCEGVRYCTSVLVPPRGVEADSVTPLSNNELRDSQSSSAALSGAVDAHSGVIDADLATVIDRWPDLSAATKAMILRLIDLPEKST